MAAILGGMTLLKLAELAAALGSAAESATTIVTDLRAKGHPESAPVPPEHLATVGSAMGGVVDTWFDPSSPQDSI